MRFRRAVLADGVDSPTLRELPRGADPDEVGGRITGRTASLAEATRIGNEVETLYTNGPAGGGGATKLAREIVAVQSILLPRNLVKVDVQLIEVLT